MKNEENVFQNGSILQSGRHKGGGVEEEEVVCRKILSPYCLAGVATSAHGLQEASKIPFCGFQNPFLKSREWRFLQFQHSDVKMEMGLFFLLAYYPTFHLWAKGNTPGAPLYFSPLPPSMILCGRFNYE